LGPSFVDRLRLSTSSSSPSRSTHVSGHTRGTPVHIHYVVQPVTRELMDSYAIYGPHLQVAMFDAGIAPPEAEVEAFADRARAAFRG
jgi:hypothetical protein